MERCILDNWKKKLPNILTFSRIFLTIPIVAVLFSPQLEYRFVAALLFVLASFTDYFDGYFARKYQVVSTAGKLMDPIGDKILVTSTLIMLVHLDKISPILVILLFSRDLLIGGIRAAAAADNVIISARSFGKWKTALQMACLPTLILSWDVFGLPLTTISVWGLWLSVVLSTISGVQYTLSYGRILKKSTS